MLFSIFKNCYSRVGLLLLIKNVRFKRPREEYEVAGGRRAGNAQAIRRKRYCMKQLSWKNIDEGIFFQAMVRHLE